MASTLFELFSHVSKSPEKFDPIIFELFRVYIITMRLDAIPAGWAEGATQSHPPAGGCDCVALRPRTTPPPAAFGGASAAIPQSAATTRRPVFSVSRSCPHCPRRARRRRRRGGELWWKKGRKPPPTCVPARRLRQRRAPSHGTRAFALTRARGPPGAISFMPPSRPPYGGSGPGRQAGGAEMSGGGRRPCRDQGGGVIARQGGCNRLFSGGFVCGGGVAFS